MLQSIPALPVGDIKKSIGFYCDKLGFTLVHHEDGFAVLMCNEVRIHLWEASDEGWRSRSNDSPVCTGAESFIAGTASCRIEVEGIDEFFLPANNLVKSTRRLQIEKYMDSFTDKELSLMEALAKGINEARNIEG